MHICIQTEVQGVYVLWSTHFLCPKNNTSFLLFNWPLTGLKVLLLLLLLLLLLFLLSLGIFRYYLVFSPGQGETFSMQDNLRVFIKKFDIQPLSQNTLYEMQSQKRLFRRELEELPIQQKGPGVVWVKSFCPELQIKSSRL